MHVRVVEQVVVGAELDVQLPGWRDRRGLEDPTAEAAEIALAHDPRRSHSTRQHVSVLELVVGFQCESLRVDFGLRVVFPSVGADVGIFLVGVDQVRLTIVHHAGAAGVHKHFALAAPASMLAARDLQQRACAFNVNFPQDVCRRFPRRRRRVDHHVRLHFLEHLQ